MIPIVLLPVEVTAHTEYIIPVLRKGCTMSSETTLKFS